MDSRRECRVASSARPFGLAAFWRALFFVFLNLSSIHVHQSEGKRRVKHILASRLATSEEGRKKIEETNGKWHQKREFLRASKEQ